MSIYQTLRESCKSAGATKTAEVLVEQVREGKVKADRISIRRLAESFMGSDWADVLDKHNKGVRVTEAAEFVDPSAFTAITGQLLVNEIREQYQLASFVGDKLARTIPVTNGNLGTQVVPYLSAVKNDAFTVQPGMPYPQTRFDGQYITHPAITKKGEICSLPMETIYSDLTGQVLDSARSVGQRLALAREEDILKVVMGITNPHSFNGTSYNTYQTSTPWINKVTSYSLTDWTGLNTLEQLFVKMKDPVTGKPIQITPKQIFVMPAQKYNVKRILNATEVENGNYATSGNPSRTRSANPLDNDYELITSAHAFNLLTDTTIGNISEANANIRVWLGDFQRAFVWREAQPLKVVEAPPMNPLEFNQDIALAVKASWMGVCGVAEPRAVVLGSE